MTKLDAIFDLVLSALAEKGELDNHARRLAELFCAMTDDGQAQFFSAAATLLEKEVGVPRMLMQAHYIGRHLRDCDCATWAGRDFVQGIFDGMCDETAVGEAAL